MTDPPPTPARPLRVEAITDASDPRVDDYRSLNDPAIRRHIEGTSMFIAEGPVAVERLVSSDHHLRSVLIDGRKLDRLVDILPTTATGNAPVYTTTREVLHDIVGFDLHRGVVAAADRRPLPQLADLTATPGRLRIAALEGLNDPENVGAVARSARAFGLDALVLDPTCTDPYARRTVRVSMGEVLHLPVVRSADWAATIDELAVADVETWALTPARDADDIWTLGLPERLALVVGAEGSGLRSSTMRRCHRRVRIPIRSGVDSLNVAAASAVAFAVTGR